MQVTAELLRVLAMRQLVKIHRATHTTHSGLSTQHSSTWPCCCNSVAEPQPVMSLQGSDLGMDGAPAIEVGADGQVDPAAMAGVVNKAASDLAALKGLMAVLQERVATKVGGWGSRVGGMGWWSGDVRVMLESRGAGSAVCRWDTFRSRGA